MFDGPEGYELADWRRQMNDIYAHIREVDDPWHGWCHWHNARSDLYRHHPMSPLADGKRQRLKQIPVFPYDPDLRFEVALIPARHPTQKADLGGDGALSYTGFATTSGLAGALGAELTVYWIEGYGGGLFIPFGDATNGTETYGGGRYIVDAIKGSDFGPGPSNGLILDFNFAYNPSCALNEAYICPLSPPENKLPNPVRGGEQLFRNL